MDIGWPVGAWRPSVGRMSSKPFVPEDFEPPTSLVGERFRLEPLGPQHNESDLAAWGSSISIEHIRATPGYDGGSWPPVGGMSAEENRDEDVARVVTISRESRPAGNESSRARQKASATIGQTSAPKWHEFVIGADEPRRCSDNRRVTTPKRFRVVLAVRVAASAAGGAVGPFSHGNAGRDEG